MTTLAFKAWEMERSIKTHFSTDSYDFFKYRGKIKTYIPDKFEISKEAIFFKQLVNKNKYATQQNLLHLFVSNCVLAEGNHKSLWGDYWVTSEADEIYDKWIKGMESFSYVVKTESKRIKDIIDEEGMSFGGIFIVNEGQHPLLLKLYYANVISLETLIVYDHYFFNFFKMWNKNINETFMWKDTYFTANKYKKFLLLKHKLGDRLKGIIINEFKNK